MLTWKFILFGHNEHEIDLVREKAKELDMKLLYNENYANDYSPVKNKELVLKKLA